MLDAFFGQQPRLATAFYLPNFQLSFIGFGQLVQLWGEESTRTTTFLIEINQNRKLCLFKVFVEVLDGDFFDHGVVVLILQMYPAEIDFMS